MWRVSSAVVAMILAIALYFTLFWGFDALRILTSPSYGLEDVWRSQVVFGLGSFFGLTPAGLIKLAAIFGALKLTVAGVCAVHVFDRLRTLFGGKVDSEILESGLLLAVIVSIAAVAPALWSNNADQVREHTIQLLLAGLAAALCIIERSTNEAAPAIKDQATDMPARAAWYAPWR
jgi:hypothetical protein